ncbi:hypothetical protein CCP3SC15_550015 [Gammaproteobacteria bacterium]
MAQRADATTAVNTTHQLFTETRENAGSATNITNNQVLTEERYRALVQEEVKAVLGLLREILHEEVELVLTKLGSSSSERHESPRPSRGLPSSWPSFPRSLPTAQVQVTNNLIPKIAIAYSDSKIGRQRHGLESLVNLDQSDSDT